MMNIEQLQAYLTKYEVNLPIPQLKIKIQQCFPKRQFDWAELELNEEDIDFILLLCLAFESS